MIGTSLEFHVAMRNRMHELEEKLAKGQRTRGLILHLTLIKLHAFTSLETVTQIY